MWSTGLPIPRIDALNTNKYREMTLVVADRGFPVCDNYGIGTLKKSGGGGVTPGSAKHLVH